MALPSPRLVARPLRSIKLSKDLLPGTGWRTSTLAEPRTYDVSIEYLYETDEDASALFVNCRNALQSEVEGLADPAAYLEEILAGTRSFSTSAEGRLREIAGLPGMETASVVDGRFDGGISVLSGSLVWHAHATSGDRDLVTTLVRFAETTILPQFFEP